MKSRTLLIILIIINLFNPIVTVSQSLRKQILGTQRKVMTEVKRTNKDVNKVKKTFSSDKKTVDAVNDTSDIITWSTAPYVPNSGMIHDYQYVYTFLHAKQEYSFKNTGDIKSIEWDSLNNVFYKNIGEKDSIDPKYQVISWHPYWMEDAYKYYNHDLLTMLSFYSYDIDPATGLNKNYDILEKFITDSVPKFVKNQNEDVEVLLSITLFGSDNNELFLGNREAQNNFIDELLDVMKRGGFNGVDVNFEQIPPLYSDFFNLFIKKLSSRLSLEPDGYSLILDVPYFNDQNTFNYKELYRHVSYFNIMGYDFSGEHSDFPGSIAPLNSMTNLPSLETAVNDFLNLDIPPSHLILSLPLYGVTWDITDLNLGSISYVESQPYYEILASYDTEYNPYYDPISASFFYVVNDSEGTKICWFENEVSLDIKYQWLKTKQLGGVGLWAIGYSQGSKQIWNGIKDNFNVEPLVAVVPISSKLSGSYGLALEIVEHKNIIGLSFLVFCGFLILGFVFSLTDWRVREALFVSQTFRVIYSVGFLIISVFGIEWYFESEPKWSLVIGLVIGGLGVLLINLIFTRNRKLLR